MDGCILQLVGGFVTGNRSMEPGWPAEARRMFLGMHHRSHNFLTEVLAWLFSCVSRGHNSLASLSQVKQLVAAIPIFNWNAAAT